MTFKRKKKQEKQQENRPDKNEFSFYWEQPSGSRKKQEKKQEKQHHPSMTINDMSEFGEEFDKEMRTVVKNISRAFQMPMMPMKMTFTLPSSGPKQKERIRIYQTDTHVIIRADMPEFKKSEIEASLTDSSVTIAAKTKQAKRSRPSEHNYYFSSSESSFSQTLPFPEKVKTDTSQASFANAILEIKVEKAEKKKAKKVKIN